MTRMFQSCRTFHFRVVAASALLGLILAAPVSAWASPFRSFGYDASSAGSANSDMTYGTSYGVLFSNPALMTRFKPTTGLEFMLYKPSLHINLMDKPPATDVSMWLYETNVTLYPDLLDRALPTQELRRKRADTNVDQTKAYVGGGITYDFDIPRFRIGGLVYIPIGDAVQVNTWFPDEREQYFSNRLHFTDFGEWQTAITGIVGTAWAPIKEFSFGFSYQVNAVSNVVIDIYIPDATVQNYMHVLPTARMSAKGRPIVGVQAEPLEWLGLSLVWRAESFIQVDGQGKLTLWNYHESASGGEAKTQPKRVVTKFRMAVDYEPMELTGGVGVRFDGLTAQLSATWNRWSDYRDLTFQTPDYAARFAPSNVGDTIIDGSSYKFKDTVSYNLAVAYSYLGFLETKLGGTYLPTPVPAQKGRTNYVHNDTLGIAVGQRIDMFKRFHTQLGFQFWHMFERTIHKDPSQIRDEFPDDSRTVLSNSRVISAQGLQTNNPGFPGYKFGGNVFVFNLSLSMDL